MSNTAFSSRIIRASLLKPLPIPNFNINILFEKIGIANDRFLIEKINEIFKKPLISLDKKEYSNITHLIDVDLLNFFSSLAIILQIKFVVNFSETISLTFDFDSEIENEKLPCLIIIKDSDKRTSIFLEKFSMKEFYEINFCKIECDDVRINFDELFKESEKMIVSEMNDTNISCMDMTKTVFDILYSDEKQELDENQIIFGLSQEEIEKNRQALVLIEKQHQEKKDKEYAENLACEINKQCPDHDDEIFEAQIAKAIKESNDEKIADKERKIDLQKISIEDEQLAIRLDAEFKAEHEKSSRLTKERYSQLNKFSNW